MTRTTRKHAKLVLRHLTAGGAASHWVVDECSVSQPGRAAVRQHNSAKLTTSVSLSYCLVVLICLQMQETAGVKVLEQQTAQALKAAAAHAEEQVTGRPPAPRGTYQTAWVQAHGHSRHYLQKTGTTVSLAILEDPQKPPLNVSKTLLQHSCEARKAQDDLKRLKKCLEQYILNEHGGTYPSLRETGDVAKLRIVRGSVATLIQSACLAAVTPSSGAEGSLTLQTVRASPYFQNGPWYDCVRVKGRPVEKRDERAVPEEPKDQFAQLRCLFRASIALPGHVPQDHDFVFLRWLKRVGSDGSPLCKAGCDKLEWDTFKMSRDDDAWYTVESLKSVICREFIVPSFAELRRHPGRKEATVFYRSVFMPDSCG